MTGCLITRIIRITNFVLGSRRSLMRAKSAVPWNGPAKKKNGIIGNIASTVVYNGKIRTVQRSVRSTAPM
jgi:hypothetical protein